MEEFRGKEKNMFNAFYRDGSDALGSEGKEMGNIVVKLKNVAKGVGTFG
jgi:hypothetical protein